MRHNIQTETINKLITMLNTSFAILEKLHEDHHSVDLSVAILPLADFLALQRYTDFTKGQMSRECFAARVEFLKHFNQLGELEKKSLRKFKFPYHYGINQISEITFAQAFGLGDHKRPSLLDSITQLWQLVVVLDPDKIVLIPQALKDYARHSLIFFGMQKPVRYDQPIPRERPNNGFRMFDINANNPNPADGRVPMPLLDIVRDSNKP